MDDSFRPSASLATLRLRAQLLERTRRFFRDRGFLEVETPVLSRDTCVDAHIEPIPVDVDGVLKYLQTSPEFAMKRLLAAGSGSIYQLTRAFRSGESGHHHNREFTILEWYRTDAGYYELMDEVEDLMVTLLDCSRPQRRTYREVFQSATGLDPVEANEDELWKLANQRNLSSRPRERDDLINYLWAEMVEPGLDPQRPTFVHDYPATQAALSIVRPTDEHPIAERFEIYFGGLEICNGWSELTDADELTRRFARQNERRIAGGNRPLPVESQLLAAMRHGLPRCAGVAVGFDRIVMLAAGAKDIREVLAFPDEHI